MILEQYMATCYRIEWMWRGHLHPIMWRVSILGSHLNFLGVVTDSHLTPYHAAVAEIIYKSHKVYIAICIHHVEIGDCA